MYQITVASRTPDQGATAPRSPFSLSSTEFVDPPRTKFLGTPLHRLLIFNCKWKFVPVCTHLKWETRYIVSGGWKCALWKRNREIRGSPSGEYFSSCILMMKTAGFPETSLNNQTTSRGLTGDFFWTSTHLGFYTRPSSKDLDHETQFVFPFFWLGKGEGVQEGP